MTPTYFETQNQFRQWLEQNYDKSAELWVGFYKVGCGKPSLTWPQSVDQAICFGWIDGLRKTVDNESYCIRFTPRKPTSNWSEINIRKVGEMNKLGLMHPAGLAAYEKRSELKSGVYSYENKPEKLSPELEDILKSHPKAWEFFQLQATTYQKTVYFWVMSAKQDATRQKRLYELIADCEEGMKIKLLR